MNEWIISGAQSNSNSNNKKKKEESLTLERFELPTKGLKVLRSANLSYNVNGLVLIDIQNCTNLMYLMLDVCNCVNGVVQM